MKHKLLVQPLGVMIDANHGGNLLQILKDAGFAPDAPCGGSGKCGKCRLTVNGREELACRCTVNEDLVVTLPPKEDARVLTDSSPISLAADPVRPGYLIAFDIGTTTVVCFLLSPDGREMAVESMLNPQRAWDADVISRIEKALAGDQELLTHRIREGMQDLVCKCCLHTGISTEEIGVISVVGNPCMQQLFMGISPKNLGAVPFAPVLTSAQILPAREYLPLCPGASLLVVPDVSGYVGADTMGCILASQMYRSSETILMVDIGTNGEMVLSHGGRMTACSAAAGPALEGANIRFGMRGSSGAIDHVRVESGELHCTVIGGGEARGICGSGVIDAVAAALELKLMNPRGRILAPEEREGERFIPLTPEVFLTQGDIRQVQMAKSAISAGILLMCAHLGIAPEEIDQVVLAGAFGSYLNPESAYKIGLFPKVLSGKIQTAGNLAGAGAKMLALNRSQLSLTQALVQRIEFIELAQIPSFSKTFAQQMAF